MGKLGSTRLVAAATGALMILAPFAASAADIGTFTPEPAKVKSDKKPFYISLFGGANIIVDDLEYENNFGTTVDADFDTGFLFGGALGYRWYNFKAGGILPRTELEISYSENELDTIDFSGNGPGNETVNGDSDISKLGLRANLFFDIPNVGGSRITPYFGGGIGVDIVDHNLSYNPPNLNFSDDDDTAFAWHVTGGLSYQANDYASLFTDIGFHQTVNAESERRIGGNSIAGANGGDFETDINSVVVRAGVSFGF